MNNNLLASKASESCNIAYGMDMSLQVDRPEMASTSLYRHSNCLLDTD